MPLPMTRPAPRADARPIANTPAASCREAGRQPAILVAGRAAGIPGGGNPLAKPVKNPIGTHGGQEPGLRKPAILTLRLPTQVDAIGGRNSRGRGHPSRERGYLARFNTPVGLRPTCGRDARGPGKDRSASRLSRERGHLARFNTPVGLRPTCGRDARGPRNTAPHGRFPWERGHLARFNTRAGLRPTAGGTPALPGDGPERYRLKKSCTARSPVQMVATRMQGRATAQRTAAIRFGNLLATNIRSGQIARTITS